MPQRARDHVLITGASSGLGAALARHYAAGGARLSLFGRDAARLATVADSCRAYGAACAVFALDVIEREAMARAIAEADAVDPAAPIDLVIANAGISGSSLATDERPFATFAVNVNGVLNTIEPAIALMRARRRGQIAIIGSLAGYRGLPSSPYYAASKMAARGLAEGLRGRLAADGIAVSSVMPGFIRTPLTASNRFAMPFLMSAEQAASRIARGLARDQGRIAFPRRLYAAVWLMGLLPQGLVERIVARAPRKF